MLGTLVLFVGDDQVAAELTQDVFAIVCRRWSEVQALDHPGPWVHRVAMNRATSWFRRRSAERRAASRLTRPLDTAPPSAEAAALRALSRDSPSRSGR